MPLDALPPDQRAVLQLVLRQGRTYDALAGLLKISTAQVRERARLGAETLVDPPAELDQDDRGEVVDYLLGQDALGRELLEESAPARDWAELLSIDLSSLAPAGLPEIPAGAATAPPPSASTPAPARSRPTPTDATAAQPRPSAESSEARSSRLGGALLLAGIGIFVIVLIVVLVNSGSNNDNGGTSTPDTTSTAAQSTTTTPARGTAGTSTTAATPKPIGTASLKTASNSKTTVGVAQLLQQGTTAGFVVAAKGVPVQKNTYHGVWLTGSGVKPLFLGSVRNQDVRSGRISAVAPVPKTIKSYTRMLLTLEPTSTSKKTPTTPGTTVLSGPLKLTGTPAGTG